MTRILVVDDNPDVRLALRLILEATEFEVAEASDGAMALSRLATERINVVLTDLVMPGVDGLSLIDTITRQPQPRPPIIAMTGQAYLAYQASLEAARALGADAVLVKPFSEVELRTVIHRLAADAPALLPESRRKEDASGNRDRRRHRRTPAERLATTIIQTILRDIGSAASTLESDLRAGGDPQVIDSVLDSAVALALSRGVDIRLHVKQVRARLQAAGFTV